MFKNRVFLIPASVFILALLACGVQLQNTPITDPEAVGTAVALTLAAKVEIVPTVTSPQIAFQLATPTDTQVPPPTQTPNAVVAATTNANANCRSGPDGNFDLVTVVNKGTSVMVIGKNKVIPVWWKLELTNGTKCWISDNLLTITETTANIPEVDSPPIPTAFYSAWVGTWTVWQNQCFSNNPGCENVFSMRWDMTGSSTLIGSYDTGGCSYTDVLTLSSDGMRADGSETGNCGQSFEVHLVMDPNLNQFRGRWTLVGDTSADGYFCGARNGAGKPNPPRP